MMINRKPVAPKTNNTNPQNQPANQVQNNPPANIAAPGNSNPQNNAIPVLNQPAPTNEFVVDQTKVAQLQEMGYSNLEEVRACLTASRNDVTIAVEFLENGIPDDLMDEENDDEYEDEGEVVLGGDIQGLGLPEITQDQIQEF